MNPVTSVSSSCYKVPSISEITEAKTTQYGDWNCYLQEKLKRNDLAILILEEEPEHAPLAQLVEQHHAHGRHAEGKHQQKQPLRSLPAAAIAEAEAAAAAASIHLVTASLRPGTLLVWL